MDPDHDPMRVVAAGFPGREEAERAEHDLRERLDLGEQDVTLGEAGGDAADSHSHLLVGRFRTGRLPEIVDMLAEHDGDVLSDVPADWTETG